MGTKRRIGGLITSGFERELTLAEKVGQLCYSLFYQQPDRVEHMIRDGQIGGIYLCWPDLDGPRETALMVNRLQQLSPIPLFIASDFEAGAGRLLPRATHLPALMALGAARSTELAREHGRITAIEARAVGVNHVFGPVADVNVNPNNPIINVRSFGGDPQLVSDLTRAWISGCQAEGVLACAKHFPGHGDTSIDTHLDLARVPHDLARMERVELAPFRAAIAAGVESVMSAHIVFPAVDPSGLPATLSQPALTGLLRERMEFDGLIVTDAMGMYAIAHHFDPGEASVQAVLAGADLVLTTEPEICYAALLDAARSGRLPASQLNASVHRILAMKERLDLFQRRELDPEQADAVCADPGHRDVARQIAEAAFTAVSGNLARPEGTPWLVLAPDFRRSTGASVLQEAARLLRQGALPGARILQISANPTEQEITGILSERGDTRGATLLTVASVRAYDPKSIDASGGEVRLVQRLSELVPTSVISLGSPYVLPAFSTASALGCAYGADQASIRAAIDVLAGRLQPRGRLPVEVPGFAE